MREDTDWLGASPYLSAVIGGTIWRAWRRLVGPNRPDTASVPARPLL